LQLPKDILIVENNDICHIFTDENCMISAENQYEYSGMTYPDVTYSEIKTGIQIKDINVKEKAKTQSVGKQACSNCVRVGCAARRKNRHGESCRQNDPLWTRYENGRSCHLN
jgi:hypothetical protein